ncbi:MAG TPA: DUF3341 domain-containing protein [Candidatus Binatia bacterium]|nr:DUF3341 domain-containing protein [Candidatus Binatia bacterium]
MSGDARLYGLVAEFDSPQALMDGVKEAYEHGYRQMDAYSPFPIEGLAEEMGFTKNRLPLLVLIGGIVGLVGGYALAYWTSVIAYPINVAGRPFHSWPAFLPVVFETTVLVAAFTAVFGMLALNGLPQPHHPVFNAPNFAMASKDRFFLVIETADLLFDAVKTRTFLEGLETRQVSEVEL